MPNIASFSGVLGAALLIVSAGDVLADGIDK
jgi:hypothetical protein